LALLSAAVLSSTAILIRYLTQTYALPALVLAFWRDAFVTLTLALVLAARRPRRLRTGARQRRYYLAYGLVLATFNAMWTLAVALNGAAVATVLGYSSTAFTALLGRWLFKERLDWVKLLAVALSMAGCVLVSGALDAAAWQANALGILTGTLSGLCFAFYSLMGSTAVKRGMNAWTTLLYTFGSAAGILLLGNLLLGRWLPGAAACPAGLFWLGSALDGWGILFVLAAGPTVVGFGLYNLSLAHLPSSVANLITTLEPVFTTMTAYVLLDERLNGVQIAGSVMILGAVVLMRVYTERLTVRPALTPQARGSVVPTD
jgi:drug/metabolite transporter (DMT)-like permease